jgi:hypothetical protein
MQSQELDLNQKRSLSRGNLHNLHGQKSKLAQSSSVAAIRTKSPVHEKLNSGISLINHNNYK